MQDMGRGVWACMQDIKLLAPRAFKKANKYGGFTWKAGVGVGAPMRGIWLEGLFGWGSSRLVGLASPACTGECGGSVVVMWPMGTCTSLIDPVPRPPTSAPLNTFCLPTWCPQRDPLTSPILARWHGW